MPNNSLFVSRNSLFLRNNSLFPNRRVPDQSAVKWRLFRSKGDLGGPESSKFPVIFPVSREFAMETGSLRTAPTASHPYALLSRGGLCQNPPISPALSPGHRPVAAATCSAIPALNGRIPPFLSGRPFGSYTFGCIAGRAQSRITAYPAADMQTIADNFRGIRARGAAGSSRPGCRAASDRQE